MNKETKVKELAEIFISIAEDGTPACYIPQYYNVTITDGVVTFKWDSPEGDIPIPGTDRCAEIDIAPIDEFIAKWEAIIADLKAI